MMWEILLGVLSIGTSAGLALWMYFGKRQVPGMALAGGCFLSAAIIQTMLVMTRLEGAPITPLMDSMWSVLIIGLSISYAVLLQQLQRPK